MNRRGQFSLIAALLVAVVLISTVIITYSVIRNSPVREQAQILSAIDETNLALKQILGFTVGYYGSVLQVTGNTSYAKTLATNYLHSGLLNIANMHPEWGTSFNLSSLNLTTYWFTNNSYSIGNLAVNYSLNGLGMYGVTYTTSCRLDVQIENTTSANYVQVIVTRDEGEPLINLGKQNFKFYRYLYTNSTWELINPTTEPTAFANGTYLIETPSEIDPYSYVLQVEDPRGIIVVASSFSKYTMTFSWNSTFYQQLQDAIITVELLQNGTARWLGQNLTLTTQARPIPPIPVKAIHVNQTINNIDQEVPFQIEDWASNYQIPLGLTNNASVFSTRTMLVFLVNPNVSKVTIWWNGSDATTQTSYAYINRYFTGDNQSSGILTNGILTLTIEREWEQIYQATVFKITSTVGSSTATTRFMRINRENSTYGADAAYVIHHGVVRDIIHQEAEWGGGAEDCPNLYAHIVITLPANATYYTYQLRLMFIDSQQDRTITDLCPIQITPPVFGSNAQGSDYSSVDANRMYGSLFTSPSAIATAGKILFYGRSSSGTANVKCLIVRHSDLAIVATTNPVTVTTTAKWWEATFPSPPTLSPNTGYILMIIPDNTVRFYYTAGSSNQGHYDVSNSYSSPTNPTDAQHNNRQYSIYCIYTTSQTENGTLGGYPVVSNELGLFYNSSDTSWQHHWSQINSSPTTGTGIMFTTTANQKLYFFDTIAGDKTGALNIASEVIELCPVSSIASVNFMYALDVTWYGAVVTFGGTTPIYNSASQSGLWITVEYPPVITVSTQS